MSRSLLQQVTQPLHAHHEQKPFHLNSAASVVIVFCGLGASISFMGAIALYFWCFKRPRAGRAGEQGEFGSAERITGEQLENRSLREKVSKRIVEQLPVITTFRDSPIHEEEEEDNERKNSRKSAECCSVCLTEFQEDGGGASEGLKVRQLPECGHCFHTECIQLWLCSYLSCPLCRRNLGNILTVSTEEQSSQVAVHHDQATTVSATVAVDHVVLEVGAMNAVTLEMRNNSVRSATSELGGSGRSTGTSHENHSYKVNFSST